MRSSRNIVGQREPTGTGKLKASIPTKCIDQIPSPIEIPRPPTKRGELFLSQPSRPPLDRAQRRKPKWRLEWRAQRGNNHENLQKVPLSGPWCPPPDGVQSAHRPPTVFGTRGNDSSNRLRITKQIQSYYTQTYVHSFGHG